MGERTYWRSDFGAQPRFPFWSTIAGTKGLILGLILIHVFMAILGRAAPGAAQAIKNLLILHEDDVLRRFFVWQLFTCGLFHFPGVMHVLFNVIMIYFFGRLVEQRLGLKRFLMFCLGAQGTAALAFLLESQFLGGNNAMYGASGIAMGLTVLGALWYPHQRVLVMFLFPVPFWALGAFLVLFDLIYMLQMPDGVAHSAHLGGALYSFIYWKWGGGVERIFGAIDGLADKQRRKREKKSRERENELRREIDRILDKVNREGMAALSNEERRFLKEASGKLRR